MQAIGGEKLALPLMLNPEGWKKTGRWNGAKGEVLYPIAYSYPSLLNRTSFLN